MSDYAVKVSVRNGRILKHMKKAGFDTLTALATATGINYPYVANMVALKIKPVDRYGQWTNNALKVAFALNVPPDELWSDAQQEMQLERNSTEVFMDETQVAGILSGQDMSRAIMMKQDVLKAVEHLKPREQSALKGIYYEGKTLSEVADDWGVTIERVRQVHHKALRKMRHASFTPLKGYDGGNLDD
jgi:RNA polymerase sigma factor (sigma-70 family)